MRTYKVASKIYLCDCNGSTYHRIDKPSLVCVFKSVCEKSGDKLIVIANPLTHLAVFHMDNEVNKKYLRSFLKYHTGSVTIATRLNATYHTLGDSRPHIKFEN